MDMPKSGSISTVTAVAKVASIAVLTAAGALALAWPRVTVAEPGDGTSALAERGTKLGAVLVEGRLVRDAATNAWCVRLHAQNRGKEAAAVGLRAGVLRTVNDPRNRAEPRPVTVWREDTTLRLGPDEERDATFPIPDDVAARITRDAEHPVGPWYRFPMGSGGAHVVTSYDVALLRIKAG